MAQALTGMTEEQRLASDPAHSVWVSANAGTGKTSVLTNRVLRLLLEGVNPSKILCLTFTNAAAAEMELRVKSRLGAWTAMDVPQLADSIAPLISDKPDDVMLHRARQLFLHIVDNPESLRIQTIHGFCQSLLRRFPLEAGVVSYAGVIDEKTSRELLREAWMRLLSREVSPSPEYRKFQEALRNMAQSLHDTTLGELLEKAIGERGKLEALFEEYTEESALEARVYASLKCSIFSTDHAIIDNYILLNNSKIKSIVNVIDDSNKYATELSTWLVCPPENIVAEFARHRNMFLTATGQPRKAVYTKDFYKKHPPLEPLVKEVQEAVFETQERLDALHAAQKTVDFLAVSRALLTLYGELKAQRALLDYDDLIHRTQRLLTRQDMMGWVMYKLDESIDHVLVDEAQDTSAEQWSIVDALCAEFFSGAGRSTRPRSLFVVGDLKQSIFSFQGAEPARFNKMHAFFREKAENARISWRSVALETSFRSTPPILKTVDAITAQPVMREALGELETVVKHLPHRRDAAGIVELWPLTEHTSSPELAKPTIGRSMLQQDGFPYSFTSQNSGNDGGFLPLTYRQKSDARKILAEKIASTIHGWLEEKRMLHSKNLPIKPGDILILVKQRTNPLTEHIIRALTTQHIPVAGIDRMSLTEHIAVMDLLALARFLLLPEDDLTLASLLKSPLCGVSEEELFTLAYGRGTVSLWERLWEQRAHFQEVHHLLSTLLADADFTSPFALFAEVLDVRGGRKAFIARMGPQVEDALNEFLNLAMQYSESHTPSLHGFLQWLESGKTEVKRDMEHGRNEVRVMTVHGAKGLQAPIVFLPDTTSFRIKTPPLLWHDDGMLLAGRKDERPRLVTALSEAEERHQMEEYYRLLYVALTRAEDELYICGAADSHKKLSEKSWYSVVENGFGAIAEKREDGVMSLASGNTATVMHQTPTLGEKAETPLPEYFHHKAAQEKEASAFQPSHLDDEEENETPPRDRHRYRRGNVLHLLMQYLPEIPTAQREKAGYALLAQRLPESTLEERQAMLREVEAVLSHPQLAPLFSKNSIAEVPVTGKLGGASFSGKIDRLAILENEIRIADYKTHRTPPRAIDDVPLRYLKQMAAYRALLQGIYPGKPVHCMLIWTQGPSWMELPAPLLDLHVPA